MTREQAREALCLNGHEDSDWVIAKVFNDHEAQLKAKDEEIERLKASIAQMKCCENCDFYPNTECGFNSQYGCLDGAVPSDWKLKRSKQ